MGRGWFTVFGGRFRKNQVTSLEVRRSALISSAVIDGAEYADVVRSKVLPFGSLIV